MIARLEMVSHTWISHINFWLEFGRFLEEQGGVWGDDAKPGSMIAHAASKSSFGPGS